MKTTADIVRSLLSDPATVAGLLEDDPDEKTFQEWVVVVAKATGWTVAHFAKVKVVRGRTIYWETPARIDGAGFPDLVMYKGGTHAFVELKTNRGALSPEQCNWHEGLLKSKAAVMIWRPKIRHEIINYLMEKS